MRGLIWDITRVLWLPISRQLITMYEWGNIQMTCSFLFINLVGIWSDNIYLSTTSLLQLFSCSTGTWVFRFQECIARENQGPVACGPARSPSREAQWYRLSRWKAMQHCPCNFLSLFCLTWTEKYYWRQSGTCCLLSIKVSVKTGAMETALSVKTISHRPCDQSGQFVLSLVSSSTL